MRQIDVMLDKLQEKVGELRDQVDVMLVNMAGDKLTPWYQVTYEILFLCYSDNLKLFLEDSKTQFDELDMLVLECNIGSIMNMEHVAQELQALATRLARYYMSVARRCIAEFVTSNQGTNDNLYRSVKMRETLIEGQNLFEACQIARDAIDMMIVRNQTLREKVMIMEENL